MNDKVVGDPIRVAIEEKVGVQFDVDLIPVLDKFLNIAVQASEERDQRIAWRITGQMENRGFKPEVIEDIILSSGLASGDPTTAWPAEPVPPTTAEGPTIIPWDRDSGAKQRFEQSRTALRAVPQHTHEPGTLGAMIHDRKIPGVPCQDPGDDELHQAVTSLRAAAVAITTAAEDLARLLP